MCITSSKSPPSSGWSSPSNLPYQEDCPLSSCQLAALNDNASFSLLSSSWLAPTTNTPNFPIASSCSLPQTVCAKRGLSDRLEQRQRARRMSLQDLPLPLRKRDCNTPHQRFAAFVAILLMHLDGGGHVKRNYKLSLQAKALVTECCRRNRMGDSHFSPLQESLSARLHGLVGDEHWNRARVYLNIYLARHHGFCPGKDEEEEDRQLLDYPSCTSAKTV